MSASSEFMQHVRDLLEPLGDLDHAASGRVAVRKCHALSEQLFDEPEQSVDWANEAAGCAMGASR